MVKKILEFCEKCQKTRLFKVGKKIGKSHSGGHSNKATTRSIVDYHHCMFCGWGSTKRYPRGSNRGQRIVSLRK